MKICHFTIISVQSRSNIQLSSAKLDRQYTLQYNEETHLTGVIVSVNSQNMKSPDVDDLFDAFLTLRNREECYLFFEDIATIQEVKALAQRLQIAKRIYYNNETYATISNECGVSVATTSRVKNSITYGSGGYKMVLDRLK